MAPYTPLMNVITKLLSGALGLTLLVGTAGCDGFLDINTDPDAASEVPGGLLFPTVLANLGSVRAIELGPTASQFSQQWSSNALFFLAAERYSYSRTTDNNYYFNTYATGLKNLRLLIEQSEAASPARVNDAGQAKILSAFLFYQATIVFGDIPFSEALQPEEFPNPKFDSQRDILLGIIALADEGIAQIDPASPFRIQQGDVVYEGDLQKWIRFGNSLKLQANMLLRGGGENRDAEIEALIANPNLIRTNADNAIIPFNDATANPLGRLIELYESASTYNFFFGGQPLVNVMNATDDPRRQAFFDLRITGRDSNPAACTNVVSMTYVGSPAGTGLRPVCQVAYVSRNFFQNDSGERLQTADQILLLEAEYLAAKGRLADADAKYRAGIQANFDYVATIDDYEASNGPYSGQESGQLPMSAATSYLASLPPLTTLSPQEAYARVVEQEYTATFGRGIDGWTLIRRTGDVGRIDRTLPVSTAETSFITRLLYPNSELDSNANAPAQARITEPLFFMRSAASN